VRLAGLRESKAVPILLTTTALYAASLALNSALVSAISADGTLSGEETSSSFRDMALLPTRVQHNPMATNWGGNLYYYVASYALPHIDLFFGRTASAIGKAATAPCLFLIALCLARCPWPVALGLGLLGALAPGILSFGWMAAEYGLECSFGLLGLLLASRPAKSAAPLAVVLAAYGALVFAPGVCFLPVVLYLLYDRHLRALRRPWLLLGGLPVLAAGVLAFPACWWTNSNRVLTGGGSLSTATQAWANLVQMLRECALRGGSYYYYSEYPALSSPALWGSAILGMVVSLWQNKALWLWIGLLGAVAIYAASGQMIGMRRGVPIVVFSMLFAGLFWSWLWQRRSWASRAGAGTLIVVSLAWAGLQALGLHERYADGTWKVRRDFRFALAPGKTMAQMYALFLQQPPELQKNWPGYEPDRTLAVLHVLATRNGEPTSKIYTRDLLLQAVKTGQAARREAQRAAEGVTRH